MDRAAFLRRGVLFQAASVGWNIVEGVIAVAAGAPAASVALIGFGIDSFVETASAAVVVWRLRAELVHDLGVERVQRSNAAPDASRALSCSAWPDTS